MYQSWREKIRRYFRYNRTRQGFKCKIILYVIFLYRYYYLSKSFCSLKCEDILWNEKKIIIITYVFIRFISFSSTYKMDFNLKNLLQNILYLLYRRKQSLSSILLFVYLQLYYYNNIIFSLDNNIVVLKILYC